MSPNRDLWGNGRLRLLKTPNIKRRMAQLRLHPNQAVALLLG